MRYYMPCWTASERPSFSRSLFLLACVTLLVTRARTSGQPNSRNFWPGVRGRRRRRTRTGRERNGGRDGYLALAQQSLRVSSQKCQRTGQKILLAHEIRGILGPLLHTLSHSRRAGERPFRFPPLFYVFLISYTDCTYIYTRTSMRTQSTRLPTRIVSQKFLKLLVRSILFS